MSDTGGLDGWTIAKGLWGLLMSVLGFFGIRAFNKLDELEEEQSKLRATTVSRDEFHDEQQVTRELINDAVERIETGQRESLRAMNDIQKLLLERALRDRNER
jgi:hypothetical protein